MMPSLGDMHLRAAVIACVAMTQLASAASVWPSGSVVMLSGGKELTVRQNPVSGVSPTKKLEAHAVLSYCYAHACQSAMISRSHSPGSITRAVVGQHRWLDVCLSARGVPTRTRRPFAALGMQQPGPLLPGCSQLAVSKILSCSLKSVAGRPYRQYEDVHLQCAICAGVHD